MKVMKIKRLSCIILLLAMLSLCACGPETAMETGPVPVDSFSGKVIDTRMFADRRYYDGQPAALPAKVRAVIVPHAQVALGMSAGAIAALAQYNPKTVVLLGPNHRAIAPRIATTYAAFNTFDGLVLPREDLVRALESRGLAGVNDALFEEEHSVGAVIPIVARYLPGARLVPLIFQKSARLDGAKKAIAGACDFSDPDTVIVASIDFSHGLTSREEHGRRAKMLEYIRDFNAAAVLGLDSTYLDAPALLSALLRLLEENGVRGVELIDESNIAELAGYEVPDATGFMTIVFYEQP